jgi:PPOX class probable F420-dependent enzyme
MDLQRAREFLHDHHRAVLATYRADGRPQLSPVLVGLDDGSRLLISTRETAVKTRNLRHDPRAHVLVLTDGFYGDWIRVDGTAEIVSLPEALELLVEYYRIVAGEHPDWDDYRAAMIRDRRVLIRITMTGAGPDVSG